MSAAAHRATVAHLGAAAAYAGFQWTVAAVVYPQLRDAGRSSPATFPAVEAGHQRRVSRVVGPLFAALTASTTALVVTRPADAAVSACAACTAVVLAVTALGAVPAHRVLAAGHDERAAAALLRWDGVRTAAATAQLALAALLLRSSA